MGIDLIRGGRIANRGFRKTKSSNSYLQSLIRVLLLTFSSTPSSAAGPMPSSTRSSTSVSINPVLIAIPSPSHASLRLLLTTVTPPSRERTNTNALSLSSAQSPTMPDFLTFLRDSELSHSDSPRLPETESLKPRAPASLSTNWLRLPPMERMCSFLEAPETARLKGTSVFTLARRDLTLLLVLEARAVNSREPEAEDDSYPI